MRSCCRSRGRRLQSPAEAHGIIGAIYKKTPTEVKEFTGKDRILALRENRTLFTYSAGLESLHGVARQINDFLIKTGRTKTRLDTTTFLDARFVRAIRE